MEHVNTEVLEKQMPRVGHDKGRSLSQPILRFNEEALADHSFYLAYAAGHLNRAFATAGAVSTIARIVRRSQLLEDDPERLSPNDEDYLLSAIELLAHGLAEDLDRAADYLKEKFSTGGAQ